MRRRIDVFVLAIENDLINPLIDLPLDKKKLSSIIVPSGKEFYTFFGKSLLQRDSDAPFNSPLAEISYLKARYRAGNNAELIYAAKIKLVCDESPDSGTIYLAFNHLSDYPNAQKMLWHYLTGNGQEVEVDTTLVFGTDANLKHTVFGKIADKIKLGKTSNSINVKQQDYENQDWRNAFGAINVPWTFSSGKVELSIQDVYKWHPNEPRVTQCVHQAMERAKKYGAKEFAYTGTKMVIHTKMYPKIFSPVPVP